MSIVWAAGHGENVGRESVGEGVSVQDAGGVSGGCHGHGGLSSAYPVPRSLTWLIPFSTSVKQRS